MLSLQLPKLREIMDSEIISHVRELLKLWDEGLISNGEFECEIRSIGIDPLLKSIENGHAYQRFGSCCCQSHPPDKIFQCEIKIEPHGFTIKPIIEKE